MKKTKVRPSTVGELLSADLLAGQWNQRKLAELLDVGEATVNRLLHNRERVTAKRAVLLSRITKRPSIEYLIAQAHTDLEREESK